MSTGYESGGFGLIQLDGTPHRPGRAAGAVARTVARHEQLFLDAAAGRAQVAIVYNPLAHFVGGRQRATAYGGPQGEVAGIERDSLLGVYRALFPPTSTSITSTPSAPRPRSLAALQLALLPYPLMLPSRLGPVLARVRRGGRHARAPRPAPAG